MCSPRQLLWCYMYSSIWCTVSCTVLKMIKLCCQLLLHWCTPIDDMMTSMTTPAKLSVLIIGWEELGWVDWSLWEHGRRVDGMTIPAQMTLRVAWRKSQHNVSTSSWLHNGKLRNGQSCIENQIWSPVVTGTLSNSSVISSKAEYRRMGWIQRWPKDPCRESLPRSGGSR